MQKGDQVTLTGTVRDIVGTNILVVTADGREYWFHEAHLSVGSAAPVPAPEVPALIGIDVTPETPQAEEGPGTREALEVLKKKGYDEEKGREIIGQIGTEKVLEKYAEG